MTANYLLISDRELPLRLLVVLREGLQLLGSLILQNRDAELDIGFRVLVAGLHKSVYANNTDKYQH